MIMQQIEGMKPTVAIEVIDARVAELIKEGHHYAANWPVHDSMQDGIRAAIEATGFVPIDEQQEDGLWQFAFNEAQMYFEGMIEDGDAMEIANLSTLMAYAVGLSYGATLENWFHEFISVYPEFCKHMEEKRRRPNLRLVSDNGATL